MQVEEEYAKFEATSDEDEDEYELEMDDDNDEVEDIAVQQEYEPDVSQSQFELELNSQEDDQLTENFALELDRLANQSFESEIELDERLSTALVPIEEEFFTKRVKRGMKKGKKKGLFSKILQVGGKLVKGVIGKTPLGGLVNAATSLVRGDIKGAIGGLAKSAVQGLGTLAGGPIGGALAGGVVDALTPEKELSPVKRRRLAMRRVARIARDSYRNAADSLDERAIDDPLKSQEVAHQAVRKAMIKNKVRHPGAQMPGSQKTRRVIKLRPGEVLVIQS